jgi:hypothetical protein
MLTAIVVPLAGLTMGETSAPMSAKNGAVGGLFSVYGLG